MRKRIFIAVAAALAGVLGLALLSVGFLAQRNKNYLIERAEQAFGRKISMDRIEVTLWPLGARLKNFAIADDPAFSAEDFLHAKDFQLELRLLPLFIGQFRPKRISLESPSITIVRDAAGRYNFPWTDRKQGNDSTRAGKIKNGAPEKQNNQLLLMSSLNISHGTLHYRDLRAGSDLVVSQIVLKISELQENQPFEFQLEAAVMAAKPNLQFKSEIGPMAEGRNYRDVRLDGEINAKDLDMGMINKTLPQFRKALPSVLRFDGIYTIKELKFTGTLNKLSLKGAVTGTDASFRFE
jgi:uncharacterized protein involved in outer membrane biogenesis